MNIEKRDNQSPHQSVNTLTHMKLARYNSSYPRYKDRTLTYLSYMSDKGKNGYEAVSQRSDEINARTGNLRNYDRALIAEFTEQVNCTDSEIAERVCLLQSKFGFPRMRGNINKQCIDELKRVFILQEVMVESSPPILRNGKPIKHRVYRPVFSLLSE